MLEQLRSFEQHNEANHFKFMEEETLPITEGSHYICIKKAFTPFAVLHMLKQLQKAQKQAQIEEVRPLELYEVTTERQLYTVRMAMGNSEASCNCSFFGNYRMVCWHLFAVLEKLQIKNIIAFDHLKKWREEVGVKSKEKGGEKRETSSYTVKKEKRLKSFIEGVSKRH